jgi:trehalose 6-phosphate synthase/phosphatase
MGPPHAAPTPAAVAGSSSPAREAPRGSRLVVVSNRLPFDVDLGRGAGTRSVGGLVSGVDAYLNARRKADPAAEHLWVGWPGGDASPDARRRIAGEAMERWGALPVFLRPTEVQRFYEGFCNRALWPLFHYFPGLVKTDDKDWASYVAVNVRFRDAILEALRPGDTVWVHDYQLMLLPALLRERAPDLPISFFLHVPFPAYDVLRVLPDAWARAIVEGMLGADVVGLHTYDYARHFLRSTQRLLGLESRRGDVVTGGRVCRVDAFPIGIDFPRFAECRADPEVARERDRFEGALAGRRAILSVDRLDYTKGILNRLLAFEAFLDRRPSWRERVSLVAVAVPSRQGIESYRKMRAEVEEAVGRINGRFGSVSWTPVLYQFRALDFAALAALYSLCDVALVTPLRDGMNLVAKEYLAARADETGVLVLSDTAGAARELGEAVLVNPYHVDGISTAIDTALEMPVGEQRRRNAALRARISRYDAARWGDEQLALVAETRAATERLAQRLLPADVREAEVARFARSPRRLVLLDYDGTLVPIVDDPAAAAPDTRLLPLLARLAAEPATQVVVVSGRDAPTLERWFDGTRVGLVAEHGARSRRPDGTWADGPEGTPGWKGPLVNLMQVFSDRLPGSWVEEKEYCVAWHYRGADDELGPVRARELIEALRDWKGGAGVHVLRGKKVVEVRPAGTSKADAVARWVGSVRPDFVLAAGDDETDEEMFAVLPDGALSIRVGLGDSRARFNVEDPAALRDFLSELAGA